MSRGRVKQGWSIRSPTFAAQPSPFRRCRVLAPGPLGGSWPPSSLVQRLGTPVTRRSLLHGLPVGGSGHPAERYAATKFGSH